ncbi:TolC family protein [Cytophagaceae bacterium ABcell3]|nr:TolC family protein [Cytophagaceae bacterium ABcell3]
MMRNKIFLVILFLSIVSQYVSHAEENDSLSLEQAVAIALHNNYNILIARNEAEISRNNAHPGNAGLLPAISLSGGYNLAVEDTEIEFLGDIPPVDQRGVRTDTYNGSIGLNYLLFDGLGNFRNFQRLRLLGESGKVQSVMEIENTILQVVSQFLEAARLQAVYRADQMALDISSERYERVRTSYEFGGANRLDVLNAEVDLSTDSVNTAVSRINYRTAIRNFNVLLGYPANRNTDIRGQVSIAKNLDEEELMDHTMRRNSALRMADQNLMVTEADARIAQAGRWPRIELNTSYGINRTEAEAGFLLFQQTIGFNGGINASFNLFNGRQQAIQQQNAQVNLENARKNRELVRLQTAAELSNAWDQYINGLQLLDLEERNLEIARINFEVTEEQFRLGQVTGTQFREAQLNLIRAETRISETRFQAKQAETELLRLAGLLETE